MSKKKTCKKILLIEPNYRNKFPPVGLMKIASYYRYRNKKYNENWDVVFYKGNLKHFVIERITENLIENLNNINGKEHNWNLYKDSLFEYIRTRRDCYIKDLPLTLSNLSAGEESVRYVILVDLINEAKDKYWQHTWELEPEWDRVYVTTLFTFYWHITVKTIEFAKKLVKDTRNLMVGGVLASIQPHELAQRTGLPLHKKGEAGGIHVGILRAGDLDKDDTQNIDELALDYSILDEIDYQYPMSNAYYYYTTRGCVNKCPFCAVPILEPDYIPYISLKERIHHINELYGEQKDLLLMDNNVLASKHFSTIIQDIIECGFQKGAKFIQPNLLDIAIRNLKNKVNDRAYIRKAWKIIDTLYDSLSGEDSYQLYIIREKYHLMQLSSTTKENLIIAYDEIKPLYEKRKTSSKGRLRFVDFNQGLDARLFTQEKANLLGKIAIRPVRIAFDNLNIADKYCKAIRMCANAGIKNFSNYLLYNFKDKPEELYERLRINVDLCDRLDISIYSFPMKFHPIRKTDDMEMDYSHNRDYIGIHWNRKYIRAVQAILNSTKGKVGRGVSFFEKAFGKDIHEFNKILHMPEQMIIYRLFFEWLGSPSGIETAKRTLGHDLKQQSAKAWWESYQTCQTVLPSEEWHKVRKIIYKDEFKKNNSLTLSPLAQELLAFYAHKHFANNYNTETELYVMKQVYDKNPTLPLTSKEK